MSESVLVQNPVGTCVPTISLYPSISLRQYSRTIILAVRSVIPYHFITPPLVYLVCIRGAPDEGYLTMLRRCISDVKVYTWI